MSPNTRTMGGTPVSFPRVSGDEPDGKVDLTDVTVFSPRERG